MSKPRPPSKELPDPEPSIKFTAPPVGAYWLGGVNAGVGFTLNTKPRWLHRVMMRWAFGWVWRDTEHPKENAPLRGR